MACTCGAVINRCATMIDERGPAPTIRHPLLDSRQPSSTEVLMRRIGLTVALIFNLTLTYVVAAGPPTPKVYRIGYLT